MEEKTMLLDFVLYNWVNFLDRHHIAMTRTQKIWPFIVFDVESVLRGFVDRMPELSTYIQSVRSPSFQISDREARNLPDWECWERIGRTVYSNGLFFDRGMEIERMKIMLKYLNRGSGTFLDLGCGMAHRLIFLKKLGFISGNCIGVDFDDVSLARAREIAKQEGIEVNLSHATCSELLIDSGSVDQIWSVYVLSWIKDWKPVVGEISRVLKKKGTVMVFNCEIDSRPTICNRELVGVMEEFNLRAEAIEFVKGYHMIFAQKV